MSRDLVPQLTETAKSLAPEARRFAVAVGLATATKAALGPYVDQLSIRREERRAHLITAAAERLRASGIPPQAVRDDILRAVLEHGALEDDPALQEMWINLLASAATAAAVPPAFAEILRQMEPVEARFLAHAIAERDARLAGATLDLRAFASFATEIKWRHLDNLERLRLVDYTYHGAQNRPVPATPFGQPIDVSLGVTSLAWDLLAACGPVPFSGTATTR